MDSPSPGLETLLARLAASGTEFVLVRALATVDARYRGRPAGQALRPTREALLGTGHQLLSTELGQLDVLGAIEGGREYADLVRESIEIEVEGRVVRVLGLLALADLKRGATDAKGRLALAVIEETLRRGGGG